MADPAFPDVPLAPGVPPVQRAEPFVQSRVDRLTSDGKGLDGKTSIQWGLFNDKGTLALKPDSIVAFEFQREYRIADYPIEEGSFENYNKVTLPYDIRIVMTKGGTIAERKSFLDTLDLVVASLDLFTVVTPERIYSNANLSQQSYRRQADEGATLLTVELRAQEIRTKVSVQFVSSAAAAAGATPPGTDTHAPSGADPRNNGSVQAGIGAVGQAIGGLFQ